MDPVRLSRELVVVLRGRRSQTALSRRLGFSTNVVYTWESGRRHPTASDVFRLAKNTGIDVSGGLRRFFNEGTMPGSDLTDAWDVAALMRRLHGNQPVASAAREVGASRLTVARWLDGSTEPRLPDLLRYVRFATDRLLEFLSVFVSPETLPSARRAFRDWQAQLRVAYDLPWSHAVLRALELESYRQLPAHCPGFLAQQLCISEAEETQCLDALARAKQIRWKNRRWVVARVLTIDTRQQPAKNEALKRHWASVGLKRLGASSGVFSYNLFAVSEADYQRIQALHRKYFDDLRAIVSASEQPERVVVANVQLFPLGG